MTFKNNLNIELDSRLIFESDKIYHSKVSWSRPDDQADSEWIYCGLRDDFKIDLVLQTIEAQFRTDPLYLKHDRDDSSPITRLDLISRLQDLIGLDFRVWDSKFENVLEFNNAGVFRRGTTASN